MKRLKRSLLFTLTLFFDSLESMVIGSGWTTRSKKKVILENAAPLRVRVCVCATMCRLGAVLMGEGARAHGLSETGE